MVCQQLVRSTATGFLLAVERLSISCQKIQEKLEEILSCASDIHVQAHHQGMEHLSLSYLHHQCFRPFVSEKFWKKLVMADRVHDIYKDIDKKKVPLPPSILAYDFLLRGNEPTIQPPAFGGNYVFT